MKTLALFAAGAHDAGEDFVGIGRAGIPGKSL